MSTTQIHPKQHLIDYYRSHAEELDSRVSQIKKNGGNNQVAKILREMAKDDRKTAANIERRGY